MVVVGVGAAAAVIALELHKRIGLRFYFGVVVFVRRLGSHNR